MRKLIFILFLGISNIFAQTINTNAYYYVYRYKGDSIPDREGDCLLAVSIGLDTIKITTRPNLIIVIQEMEEAIEAYGGQLLKMWGIDAYGEECLVKLLTTDKQRELHVIYDNIDMGFILDE